ncbi:succinate dehydrogenase, hydrophobic membrane anchor protein [Polynucleobacter paneuropaeus]|uniref:succinate dehydrogenase, hydrophobic membrane anchor protein n=1 Tax=Polynucleobacter paneuropaeus TaxID=2527775 RepID=UPI001BFD531E|nr:succinate dehydrogenase, hydrophobic membrane anchor protein [Polynucleobacter paneuropaeus]MBT8527205.1 succinate dehydrogenase, hydrophobic membrane anchor protein [Polynucleobacter paneuropaeus]MBT8533867.1 succinate dehydrogenase, hydrophobic membrane anchor protein [Polynucleobacter paneuropaeus]MBT8634985.1 succinate dehydrogenase, hydrophobic membrane anchor protein [Polynucleobacter paneuropaeus]QWD51677.1 succinate dehydrogenase, hydrophobic membrane anchor protein [Polynucleobacter
MPNYQIGPKRLVVGAHYGLKEWIIQRITAIVMVVFTVVLLVDYCVTGGTGYAAWLSLFSNQFMKLLTLLALLSLFYHAWIGIRDIWMDYVKPVSIRLGLQVLTVLYLVACAAYAVQILWKV